MLTASSRFELELKKVLIAEIDRLTLEVVLGHAVTDFTKYQHYIGRISALSTVVAQHCDEVNRLIEER